MACRRADPATAAYQSVPFSSGFVNGYLTMDTLGALVFGIVIVNAARSRVKDAGLLTRYTILAGLIAGVGLTLVYLSLFGWAPAAARWCLTPPTVR